MSRVLAEPLQVYILAGQSNMAGHAKVETFDYIGDDPATAPLLEQMRAADGSPRVCERVWISYLTNSKEPGEGFGKLTAGYGARKDPTRDGGKIGPEFTFGITLETTLDAPILIIKTAWGGKSLNTDFRPPSAGPYEFSESQLENLKKRGKDIAQAKADKAAATGKYYRLMVDHVKHVLGDIKRVCPEYDEEQGYRIAGFVWFQGWNDMVERGTYPNRGKPGGYDQYSECLAAFIRDVRKDLSAPRMPFVIGVMGVNGPLEFYTNSRYKPVHASFRAAMAAPAALPEFKGNVAAVETAPYWDRDLAAIDAKRAEVKAMSISLRNKHKDHANKDGTMTPAQQREYVEKYRARLIPPEDEARYRRGASNAGYHYLGCAKTMALIGKAFAEAVLELASEPQR